MALAQSAQQLEANISTCSLMGRIAAASFRLKENGDRPLDLSRSAAQPIYSLAIWSAEYGRIANSSEDAYSVAAAKCLDNIGLVMRRARDGLPNGVSDLR